MEFEKLKFNDQPTEDMVQRSIEFLKMISSNLKDKIINGDSLKELKLSLIHI